MNTQVNASLETVVAQVVAQVLPQVLNETLKAYEMAYSEPKQVTAKQAYANANKRDIAKNKATQAKVCKQNKPHRAKENTTVANARKITKLDIPNCKPAKCYFEGTWLWLGWNNKPSENVRKVLISLGFGFSKTRKEWYYINAR